MRKKIQRHASYKKIVNFSLNAVKYIVALRVVGNAAKSTNMVLQHILKKVTH